MASGRHGARASSRSSPRHTARHRCRPRWRSRCAQVQQSASAAAVPRFREPWTSWRTFTPLAIVSDLLEAQLICHILKREEKLSKCDSHGLRRTVDVSGAYLSFPQCSPVSTQAWRRWVRVTYRVLSCLACWHIYNHSWLPRGSMAKSWPATAARGPQARGLPWRAEMQLNCPGYQERLCLSSWNRYSTRTGKARKNRTRRESFLARKNDRNFQPCEIANGTCEIAESRNVHPSIWLVNAMVTDMWHMIKRCIITSPGFLN